MSPDVKALSQALRAFMAMTQSARVATISYLIDFYINQPVRDKAEGR
jgi:hypothetical protein